LADPQRTVYSHSCRLSSTDQAQVRESVQVEDQHPNHWAMPPCVKL